MLSPMYFLLTSIYVFYIANMFSHKYALNVFSDTSARHVFLRPFPFKNAESASYFNLPCLDRALLRLKRHMHPVSVANPGATCDGAMAVSCGVIGLLEKGFFANTALPDRNGMSSKEKVRTVAVYD